MHDDMRRDVQKIFKSTPYEKQVMMFSATLTEGVRNVCRRFMNSPLEIQVNDETKLTLHGLRQYYVEIEESEKFQKLSDLLDTMEFNQVVIFVSTTFRAEDLSAVLNNCYFPSICIHGKMDQRERIKRFNQFRTFKKRILVSTDLSGRGVDYQKVDFVINYDMSHNSSTYLHRIGRAGRFGTEGIAVSFITTDKDISTTRERKFGECSDHTDKEVLEDAQKRFLKEGKILRLPSHMAENPFKEKEDGVKNVIGFNVGGKLFETSVTTIREKVSNFPDTSQKIDHYLMLLSVSKDVKMKDNSIFIDRNPEYFSFILDYLRNKGDMTNFIVPSNDRTFLLNLKREAEFFTLPHFVGSLKELIYKDLFNSNILITNERFLGEKLLHLAKDDRDWELIYRGSRDGFTSESFHNFCDNALETMVVIQTHNGSIFGGFNPSNWSGEGYKNVNKSWLFSLVHKKQVKPMRIDLVRNSQYAIHCKKEFGPVFGGSDIFVGGDYFNMDRKCFVNQTGENFSYLNPDGNPHYLNSGEKFFNVVEMEVYKPKIEK